MKKIIRTFIFYLGQLLRFVQMTYLRSTGIKIGHNTMISLRAKLDVKRGNTVIGDNCHITYGCVILSHDYTAKLLGKGNGTGKVIIGNNVFIGVNSVVLANVTIGENSIIGAGSIVTKDIPPNSIAIGNPAKVVKTLA